jgi:hypothetical protein
MIGVISFHRLETGLLVLVAVGPAVLIVVSALHLDSVGGVIALIASAMALAVVVRRCGARIRSTSTHLVLGFSPFWRSRLGRDDIARVDAVTVRPLQDYGGWGIKGRPRRKGLLYSAGGEEAIKVELTDGRVYLASVRTGSSEAVCGRIDEWLALGAGVKEV